MSGYAVFGDWLAQSVEQCTCYGGEFGHEPGCGYEPLIKITEPAAIAELRAQAQAVATGNDVERIPDAVDLLTLLDEISGGKYRP